VARSHGTERSAPIGEECGTLSQLKKIFEVNRQGINLPRGLVATAVLLIPFVVLAVIDEEKYWLSVSFAALFVGLSDPGGLYRVRFLTMAKVGVLGGLLTALGFALGGGPWGYVVLAAFVVTLLCGLALKFGAHSFTAALLLNAWFLVALSVPASKGLTVSESGWWQQTLAWLIGAALWIALTLVAWVLRGRKAQASHFPEIPANEADSALTRPAILFALIRAVAIAIAVAIAFGLDVPNADWMPIAALVAMKTSLGQATLAAEQRLTGAFLGAIVATAFLLTVDSIHALEVVIVIAAAFAASFRAANYAIYCAAVAATVLIATDLPNPTHLAAEGRRVLFTFIGLGIGLVVLGLAGLLQQRSAKAASPQP
jgi:hypothetical protein